MHTDKGEQMDSFFHRFFPDEISGNRQFHRSLRQHLPNEGKILDLGCGKNTNLARYRRKRRRVWGTDLVYHPQLEYPRWFRPIEGDGRLPFSDRLFRLVTSTWVLEHVEQPIPFLQEVHRVLKPGGVFVSLTVNASHYLPAINQLLGCLPHSWTQKIIRCLFRRPEHDTFPTYYRLNTISQINRVAQRVGLQVVDIQLCANQGYFSFWKPLWQAAVITDWLLEQIQPGMGKIYLLVTLKKPGSIKDKRKSA